MISDDLGTWLLQAFWRRNFKKVGRRGTFHFYSVHVEGDAEDHQIYFDEGLQVTRRTPKSTYYLSIVNSDCETRLKIL